MRQSTGTANDVPTTCRQRETMAATDTKGPPSPPSVKPGMGACTSLRAAFLLVEAEAVPKNLQQAQQALLRMKDFHPAVVAGVRRQSSSLSLMMLTIASSQRRKGSLPGTSACILVSALQRQAWTGGSCCSFEEGCRHRRTNHEKTPESYETVRGLGVIELLLSYADVDFFSR
jgi:hypothetical protein